MFLIFIKKILIEFVLNFIFIFANNSIFLKFMLFTFLKAIEYFLNQFLKNFDKIFEKN